MNPSNQQDQDLLGHAGAAVWVIGFTGNERNLLPGAHFFVTIDKVTGRTEVR